jgi:hypothetical protein
MTLAVGSIMTLTVQTIKSDIYDETISISSLIIKCCSGDYDGDELNGISVKELSMVRHLMSITPWEMLYSKKEPKMTDIVMISKPDRVTVNAWLSEVPENNHFRVH